MEEKIKRAIINLCVVINTQYSTLPSAPLELSIQKLLKQSPQQALTFINQIVQDLSQNQPGAQLHQHQNYQHSLQKLQQEIRNHIKIEQQFKIYIESIQQKLENAQKAKQDLYLKSQQLISNLRNQNIQLQQQLKKMKSNTLKGAVKQGMERTQKFSQNSKYIQVLLQQQNRLRQENQRFQNMLNQQKPTVDQQYGLIEFYKRKYQEKCVQFKKLKRKLRSLRAYEKGRSISPFPNTLVKIGKQPISQSISTLKRVSSTDKVRVSKRRHPRHSTTNFKS